MYVFPCVWNRFPQFFFWLLLLKIWAVALCYPIWQPLAICGYLYLNELKWKWKIQFLRYTRHMASGCYTEWHRTSPSAPGVLLAALLSTVSLRSLPVPYLTEKLVCTRCSWWFIFCHLDGATVHQDIWLNINLGVSVRLFWGETTFEFYRLSKEDCFLQCGHDLSNQLKG